MKTKIFASIIALVFSMGAASGASTIMVGVYVDFIYSEETLITEVAVRFRSFTEILTLETADQHKVFRLHQTSKVYSDVGCTGAVFGIYTPPDSKIGTPDDPLEVSDRLSTWAPYLVGMCTSEDTQTYETWAEGYILWTSTYAENDICRIPNCSTVF